MRLLAATLMGVVTLSGCARAQPDSDKLAALEARVEQLESKLARVSVTESEFEIASNDGGSTVVISTDGAVPSVQLSSRSHGKQTGFMTAMVIGDSALINGSSGGVEWSSASPKESWENEDGHKWVTYDILDRLRIADFIRQKQAEPQQLTAHEICGLIDKMYVDPAKRRASVKATAELLIAYAKLAN